MKDFGLEEKITKEELENQISLNIPKGFALLKDTLKECGLENIEMEEKRRKKEIF